MVLNMIPAAFPFPGLPLPGSAAMVLRSAAQRLFLPKPGGKATQIIDLARCRRHRHGPERRLEIAQGGKPAPAAAKIGPDLVEGRHPLFGRPLGHRPDIRFQENGIRQFQRETIGQLLDAGQHIFNPDARRQAIDGGVHPIGHRADLVRGQILRLETQVDRLKPG